MRPAAGKKHHGLLIFCTILIFLVIGCLAAAFLMSEKLKSVLAYADDAAARLAASEQQKNDISEQLNNIKTLNSLAAKVTAPAASLSDVVWDTYSSANLSMQYPDGYTVVKATSGFPALTIKSDKGKIEIFREKDFPGGSRMLGFSGDDPRPPQAEIDEYIPKEFNSAPALSPDSKIQPYSVWVYYGTGDEATKAILDQAVSTIKVVK